MLKCLERYLNVVIALSVFDEYMKEYKSFEGLSYRSISRLLFELLEVIGS